MIIGVTGTLGAGKTTVANYLKSKGFKHYSVREFIAEEVTRRGLVINRDSLVNVANELRTAHGPEYIVASLGKRAAQEGGNAVIESIRAVGEAEEVKKEGGYLLAVSANPRLRYERARLESSATTPGSFEEFITQEEREMHSTDPAKQNIAAVMLRADYQILNNSTMGDLENQIDAAIMYLEKVNQKV
ncbi:MAG TPA: AAA family ATPase [Candidatus Paceibacterota bacterium]|nr:AAA family ATPase [Candidatus Paceibacterota bacterium]